MADGRSGPVPPEPKSLGRGAPRPQGRSITRRPPRPRPPSPDAFVALQVPPLQSIRASFAALHAQLEDQFSQMLIDAEAAHVTLGVLRLAPTAVVEEGGDEAPPLPPPRTTAWGRPRLPPDPDRLAAAAAAVEEAAASLRPGGPLRLVAGPGVGQFGRGRVLFLPVTDAGVQGGGTPGRLAAAEAAVRSSLSSRGLTAGSDSTPFTPHVTVAKARAWWEGGPRAIPPGAYAHAADRVGAVAFTVGSLQVCEMGNRPGGQYYRVLAEADFG